MPARLLSSARMVPRRRFLALSASALGAGTLGAGTLGFAALPPEPAPVTLWSGTGLGTALSLRLVGGTPAQARRTLARVGREIARIEAMASLHRDSALTRLNRDGHLAHPSEELLALLALADQVHDATGGAFDPTVQPLYAALADGRRPDRALIGWERVRISAEEIRLDRGQALTLNGIAQGWAADRIAGILAQEGYGRALIDMGEARALGLREDGRPWRAEIATPQGVGLARVDLCDRALATSSPSGTRIGAAGLPHILGPQGQAPVWNTVSVSAPGAALADALSTAFCLMGRPAIDRALARFAQTRLEAAA